MDFSKRTDRLELLDQPHIPAEDIQRNLYELAIINQKLGGHRTTWIGFSDLVKKAKETRVCEIGCGGGDNLKAIERKAGRHSKYLSFQGIDINPDCIAVATNKTWKRPAQFVLSDYKKIVFPQKPDILFVPFSVTISKNLTWLRCSGGCGITVKPVFSSMTCTAIRSPTIPSAG